MPKFNVKEFTEKSIFTCDLCGYSASYKVASKGCSRCGNTLFVVATRSGTPNIFDPDKYDPYVRQKQAPFSNNSGDGYNLTRVDDEHWEGAGLGGRFRGQESPKGFSSFSDEYESQYKKDIPGSHDDLISDGDFSGADDLAPQDFSGENEALGSENVVSRALDGSDSGSLDSRLRKSRVQNRVFPERADSVYRNISTRQRGNR